MARIRTIKPEIWTSEQFVECSTNARLLFVGLLNFCDDAGRHPASVKRLKMEVFPGDDFSPGVISGWVDELVEHGLVGEYHVKGHSQTPTYWYVTGWDKHQKIDRPNTKYPGPFDEGSTIIRRGLDDHSPPEGSLRESNIKTTSLSPEATDAEEEPKPAVNGKPTPQEFFDRWNVFAKAKGLTVARVMNDERRRKIKTRLGREGWWEAFTEAVGKLPVPNDEKFVWQPDLDWLIANDTNVAKLAEGRYDRPDPPGCESMDFSDIPTKTDTPKLPF